MLQDVTVGLIVATAVAYVVWRYMPQRWRQRLGRVHPGLAQAPGCGGGDGGGCSRCGSCGGAGDPGAALHMPGAKSQESLLERPVTLPKSRR